jgi:2-dehydropantoate 2-reductase
VSISRIAVLGTGANGAAFAADLTRAGHDVTLIDQWPENVEAMRSNGVTVDDGDSQRTTRVSAHHLSDIATMRESFDLVVLGVKAYDTRWSCELIRPLLAADGLVVGMQNGMTMETIADVVGNHRTVGCVIEVAANMFVPGHVQQQAPMWFALGVDEEGPAQRVPEVVSVFGSAGTATSTDDIFSSKWMKLVANSCELVTSAILNLPLAEAIKVPGMYDFMLRTGVEAARTGARAGARIVSVFGMNDVEGLTPDDYAGRLLDAVLEVYTLPDTKTTVLQDWVKGRRAEADDINGHVARTATRLGQSAPLNRRVLELAQSIESGALVPDPANAPLMTELGLAGGEQERMHRASHRGG